MTSKALLAVLRFTCWVATIAFGLLSTANASTSTPPTLATNRSIDDYVVASWREARGLPVDSVGMIAQTRDGYLWMGTEVGLVRFDGVRFTTFSTENTPELLVSQVDALFVARDGVLWIGLRGGGIVRYEGGSFRRVPTPLRYVVGFAQSGDGAIWVGAPGAVVRLKDGSYRLFSKKAGYPGGRLRAVAADETGAYFALPSGVVRVDERGAEVWTAADGLAGGDVTSLLSTARGLLAGNENGGVDLLAASSGQGSGKRRFANVLPAGSRHPVTSMLEDADGGLWLSTAGGGILRLANGSLDRLAESDGLTANSVNHLAVDREGNIWGGTTGGGLVRLRRGGIRTARTSQPLNGEWVLQMLQARDGSVWFSTNGGGVNHLVDGTLTRITSADGLRSNTITALTEDRDGSVWVGSDHGVQRIRGDRVVQTMPWGRGLEGVMVFAMAVTHDGTLWVSTTKGLHRVVDGNATRLTEKDGMTPGPIVGIREAADGSLWLARPMSIERFSEGRLTAYTREDGLRVNNIFSIATDEKDGSLWIAAGTDGIARIRHGVVRLYGSRDGIPAASAYGIVQDREGNLWIPTNAGLVNVRRADLDRFDRGDFAKIPVAVFRRADGLKTSDFSGGTDQPGFRALDGTLWFATTRGLTVVDPARTIVTSTAPQVLVESVTVNGTTWPPSVPIDVPGGERQIEIAYTAPSFAAPEMLSFRYRLEGYDDQWHEAGSRRTAYFTNVPPGTYRFRVQAVTPHGVTREAVRAIRLKPRLHETWLFRTVVILALALVALVLLRRRREAAEQRQGELRRSEQHFRSLIENGSDMILMVDVHGTITYVSDSVTRLLGWSAEALTPGRFGDLLTAPEQGARLLAEVEASGTGSETLEFRDASGVPHAVEAVGSSYGSYGRIILNCRDVTERRRLEQQLEQANRVASLGRLAATVSHEFNNVLMGIQPFVELLNRKSSDPAVVKATTHMAQSVSRGKRITEEILRYTRPAEPTLRPVGVREWLGELESEIAVLAGPSVRVTITAARALTINADAAQLAQVLTNMAINARDAGATTVRLSATAAEPSGVYAFGFVRDAHRYAHLRLMDDGAGIPESILPHIFEPLFTTKSKRGTGLGLAVAHKVVLAHGGEIHVESRPGKGTTFHIFLPIGISAVADACSEPDESPCAGEPCRLLFVEDTPEVAEAVVAMLDSEGFDVHLAVTGEDALDVIPGLSPDVVILDVNLPGIDGVELARRIAERWPAVGTIFSTAQPDAVDMDDPSKPICLVKPYGRDELLAAIAATLERRRVAVA